MFDRTGKPFLINQPGVAGWTGINSIMIVEQVYENCQLVTG